MTSRCTEEPMKKIDRMMVLGDLFPYQTKAIEFQCARKESALWLDPGLGKTVITLTSIAYMLNCGYLSGVIIVAPIRVCRMVWRQEAAKWKHTAHLTFSMVVGDKDQRIRALTTKADIYLINYENLEWLVETLRTYYESRSLPLPANGIVFDEISKCKNSSTRRVKALMKMLPRFIWRTGLTGTPAGNGYKDLHGQYLVLDDGKRLGTSKTIFENRWYHKAGPYKMVPFNDSEEKLKQIIGDMTLEMSAEDYNPLPDIMINDVTVELPPDMRELYEQLEREFFMQLENGTEIELFNKAALTNKCLQFANGAVYPVAGMPLWEPLHDLKLDALEDILEEANGQPVLCSYAFRSDAERIMKRFHKLRPINLTACKSEQSLKNAMARWVSGDCPLMIGHPACLHPETQVLTKRAGWIKLIDVMDDDMVFDGVEFVSHGGCSYSGHKEVIDLFGITMTPDHKLLIQGDWREAKDVQDTRDIRSQALFQWKSPPDCERGVSDLRDRTSNGETERHQEQSSEQTALRTATKERAAPRKAHVYDLVDCGPRHQFLIRNADGEMFISHNSMGHGIDGLQKTGHILVWFGLNWSLDLYDQFNARIRRQGQGAPVICHRIVCADTLDQAQELALDGKAKTQSALRNAIKEYWNKKVLRS
jgi:hypothetical protein